MQTMRVLRGTFRLSLVVLAVGIAWGLWAARDEAAGTAAKPICAEWLMQEQAGGPECANGPFASSLDEFGSKLLRDDPFRPWYDNGSRGSASDNFRLAFIGFFLTNLLGLVGLAVWRLGAWVGNGYRDRHDGNSAG